jgi:hypothetical protein
MRPPRDAFTVLDDGECTITPQAGSPFTAPYSRVPPSAPAPNIEADAVVTDTNPRFSFWKSDLSDDIKLGDGFEIEEGPDAGVYSIDRVDDLDGETLEVVAVRR